VSEISRVIVGKGSGQGDRYYPQLGEFVLKSLLQLEMNYQDPNEQRTESADEIITSPR
jgi:hypothetical protein